MVALSVAFTAFVLASRACCNQTCLLLFSDKAAADANAAAWAAYYAQYSQQPQAPMTPTSGAPGTTQTNGQGTWSVSTSLPESEQQQQKERKKREGKKTLNTRVEQRSLDELLWFHLFFLFLNDFAFPEHI